MAVVQISRIQHRRGRKNQGSGLPQLASGELGWAVDTQELYIGNGSVAEGAPYVGNTKLLTEHDNLFAFATNYQYRSNAGTIVTGPNDSNINRSLQERLDDRVSIRSFGAPGDGSDQTEALQRALNQLYLNSATLATPQSRVILHVEPGNYLISSTIYIPPYVQLVGAGKQKTIFTYTGTGSAFVTSRGPGPGDNTFTNEDYTNSSKLAANTTQAQARYIHLEGFTLNLSAGQKGITLESCRNSYFGNIEIVGSRELGTTPNYDEVAIQLDSLSSVVTCKENFFEYIDIKNIFRAVYSDFDISYNTFEHLHCFNLYNGFVFGENSILGVTGQFQGPSFNTIENSIFSDIEKQGIYIENGKNNRSVKNQFTLVGNNGGSNATPNEPVIQFLTPDNVSLGDWFDRTSELGNNNIYLNTIAYVPEVSAEAIYDSEYTYKVEAFQSPTSFEKLFKLPADRARSFEIDYLYKSSSTTRHGVMRVTVDPVTDDINFSDDFDITGSNSNHADQLKFQAQGFYLGLTTNPIDTVGIMMLNSTGDNEASIYYRVKTIT